MKLSEVREYDQLPRFVSYWYQIETIRSLLPKKTLEIGKGNGFVYDYLRKNGLEILSFDFDKEIGPDIVGDVREINLEDNSFDLISCCEVLEHVSYKYFSSILKSFRKISSKYVLISLPYSGVYISMNLRFTGIKRFFKRELIGFRFLFPPFYRRIKKNKHHKWEIGCKGTSLRRVKKDIKRYFLIEKEFSNKIYPHHKFFLLKIK